MAHIFLRGWRGVAVVGLVVALHVAAFRLAGRPASGRTQPAAPVQWAQALPAPAPAAVSRPVPLPDKVVVPRAERKPSRAATPARGSVVVPPPAASSAPTAPTAATATPLHMPPRADAPLDLSPETLRRAIAGDRRSTDAGMARRWTGAALEPFGMPPGPARTSETVGASGSRVTRVETAWGTYCVRTLPPGQPPAPGPGLEQALPTNCP